MLETDGYLLDRFKTFYAGEYGVLTFVEDHGLMQNCEAAGNGDSGLYPGAGAETGDRARHEVSTPSSATARRSATATPTTTPAATRAPTATPPTSHHNNFYDNALGFTTDVFTAAGPPRLPAGLAT